MNWIGIERIYGSSLWQGNCPHCTKMFISDEPKVVRNQLDRHIGDEHSRLQRVPMDLSSEDREFLSGCRIAVD